LSEEINQKMFLYEKKSAHIPDIQFAFRFANGSSTSGFAGANGTFEP
jgi:hypothetical protein